MQPVDVDVYLQASNRAKTKLAGLKENYVSILRANQVKRADVEKSTDPLDYIRVSRACMVQADAAEDELNAYEKQMADAAAAYNHAVGLASSILAKALSQGEIQLQAQDPESPEYVDPENPDFISAVRASVDTALATYNLHRMIAAEHYDAAV